MLKLVLPGSCNCETDAMVSKSRPRTFMEELEGFTATGVMLWERYQAKIWWPNLDGFEEAPATAIRGDDMKVRAAVCMVGSVVGIADWRDRRVCGWVLWKCWIRTRTWNTRLELDWDGDPVKVGYDVSTRAEAALSLEVSPALVL